MTNTPESTPRKPLRVWPGVTLAVLMALIAAIAPLLSPDGAVYGLLGGVACGIAIVLWWLFFSRAPWLERLAAVLLIVAGLAATRLFVHPSIATGHMGMTLPLYGMPALALALVAWAVATRRLSAGRRRAWMVVAIAGACSFFTLIRTDGVSGDGESDFHWRWTPTAEERLLAQSGTAALPTPAPPAEPAESAAAPAAGESAAAAPPAPQPAAAVRRRAGPPASPATG